MKELETPRLFIRPFALDDAQAVFEFGSDPIVQRYTGEPPLASVAEARSIITNRFYHDYHNHGYGRYAVVYKPEKRVIGFSGLKFLPEIGETDIGFRFLSEYWGRGIATESAEKMLEFGLSDLALSRIIAIAMPENIASCRVLEKIGMKYYQSAEYDGDGGNHNWYKIYARDFLF